jgi:hypothetical protein
VVSVDEIPGPCYLQNQRVPGQETVPPGDLMVWELYEEGPREKIAVEEVGGKVRTLIQVLGSIRQKVT